MFSVQGVLRLGYLLTTIYEGYPHPLPSASWEYRCVCKQEVTQLSTGAHAIAAA